MSIGHHVEGSAPAPRPVRPVDIPAIIVARLEPFGKPPSQCQVFLKCTRPHTTHIDHPTLGEVPSCDEHQIWYEELS